MSPRSRWKTVIDGDEHTFTSEQKAYDFLIGWALDAEDGDEATVYELEPNWTEWQVSERLKAGNGRLTPA